MKNYLDLFGRLSLGQHFLLAGIDKISGYAGAAADMNPEAWKIQSGK